MRNGGKQHATFRQVSLPMFHRRRWNKEGSQVARLLEVSVGKKFFSGNAWAGPISTFAPRVVDHALAKNMGFPKITTSVCRLGF